MKKVFILIILLLSFILASNCMADGYEAVTIDDTAGGVALTAATYGRARYALCRVETAAIRYTIDGSTAPTAAVGMLVQTLEFIVLDNPDKIKNFRGFRTTGTSGVLHVFYFDN